MRENVEKEKWRALCEQAAVEQDSQKLAALILEINFMLEAKELRLRSKLNTAPSDVERDSDLATQH